MNYTCWYDSFHAPIHIRQLLTQKSSLKFGQALKVRRKYFRKAMDYKESNGPFLVAHLLFSKKKEKTEQNKTTKQWLFYKQTRQLPHLQNNTLAISTSKKYQNGFVQVPCLKIIPCHFAALINFIVLNRLLCLTKSNGCYFLTNLQSLVS